MDIAGLSMVMSQSKMQEAAGLAILKMAMNTGKENAERMTELLNASQADPDRGGHIDVRV